jgi:hypothetical protein
MTLKDELIAAIRNEQNMFYMGQWGHGLKDEMQLVTCDTASCMGGHIEALRPELAKQLAKKHTNKFFDEVRHGDLAAEIWHIEMGEECTLDFFGRNFEIRTCSDMEAITRDDAIRHIEDKHEDWPRLSEEQAEEEREY